MTVSPESAIKCPTCSAPMIRRKARSGRNAGREFWGCSRYPACRTIVEIEPEQATSAEAGTLRRVAWSDAGRRPGWSGFYAPAGGRLRSWDPMVGDRIGDSARRGASQAAFYLSEHPRETIDDGARIVVDIMRRLLTRGDRPPVDLLVEDWVLSMSGLAEYAIESHDKGDLTRRLAQGAPRPSWEEVIQGLAWRDVFEPDHSARGPDHEPIIHPDYEEPFIREVVRDRFGPSAGHWFTPQAAFAPLLSASIGDGRRADFLVCHPFGAPAVVEIDGSQHERAVEVDRNRDQALVASGIECLRVRGAESGGPAMERLATHLPVPRTRPAADLLRLIWAAPVASRIARAIVEGAANGWLRGDAWRLRINEPTGVSLIAVQATLETLAAVADVWSVLDIAPSTVTVESADAVVEFSRHGADYVRMSTSADFGRPDMSISVEPFLGPWHILPTRPEEPAVVVRSACLPVSLRDTQVFGAFARRVPDEAAISRAALVRLLQGIFAKREFYPAATAEPRGQETALRRLLGGRDTAVLLTTGAGKSLIYQLAGLLLPGITVVVDPIVALIDDQIEGLALQGIDRAIGITGVDTRAGRTKTKLDAISAGDALFCFVAPQRLQSRAFREALRGLSVVTPISVAVVDEAHCVSEWGHTFMAAYLGIGRALRDVGTDLQGEPPPVLALTGTASRSVLRDMLIELEIDRSDPGAVVVPVDFDRPELSYAITPSREDEVLARLIGTIRSLPGRFGVDAPRFFAPEGLDTYSGIVFVQTVNPPKAYPGHGIVNIQSRLGAALNVPVGIYAGSAPKSFHGDWDAERRANARAFKANNTPILVATKAFGMGIDKPNIRYTVHVGIPGSIEAFYQEAGRAGRDRQPAQCLIVHDPSDAGFWRWAHEGSFKGVEADVAAIAQTLNTMGGLGERRRVDIPRSSGEDAGDTEERAIHRLRLLGVISDYTIDWGSQRFELFLPKLDGEALDAALLAYVRRTQPGRVAAFEKSLATQPATTLAAQVLRNARHLVTFIYDTVAKARLQALVGMEELANNAKSDDAIRDRILRYLELGKVAAELETLIDQEPFAFDAWQELYVRLDTVEDGREWRGATTRFLESAPDHPGLLIGRALAEATVPEGDVRLFSGSLAKGFISASERYDVDPSSLALVSEWAIEWLHARKPAWAGLAMLIAERAGPRIGEGKRNGLERRIIRHARIADPHELAMAYVCLQARYLTALTDAAHVAEEMLVQ